MRVALALVACLHAVAAQGAELVVGPYIQDVRPDGFTVAFETDGEVEAAVEASGVRVRTTGTRHEARLEGLAAGARHPYRVLVAGIERAQGEARTAPDGPRPFTFLVYGDTRSNPDVERRLVDEMVREEAAFAIHTGDLVPKGSDEAAWLSFFRNEAPLLRSTPVYLAVGNHELWNDAVGAHVQRYFVPPEDGRARRYYSFRFAGARFIVLDGNGRLDEQTAWLERTLEAAAREGVGHVFVAVHQPPLSVGSHCGAAPKQADWIALFERHRVRAVFGGHDHAYERLERLGVRYFVSGGGGAHPYEERASCPLWDRDARRAYSMDHHYLRVRVAGDEVEVSAVRLDAPPIETLRWRAGELVAAGPAPPIGTARARAGADDRWVWASGGAVVFLIVATGLVRRRRR